MLPQDYLESEILDEPFSDAYQIRINSSIEKQAVINVAINHDFQVGQLSAVSWKTYNVMCFFHYWNSIPKKLNAYIDSYGSYHGEKCRKMISFSEWMSMLRDDDLAICDEAGVVSTLQLKSRKVDLSELNGLI